MSSPYTTLGLPPDGVAWAALAAACALVPALAARSRRALAKVVPVRVLLPVLAVGAALLSAGYVAYYLRGGPRIIDATSYFLQAKAMSRGYFAFPVPTPLGSFGGRFLLGSEPHALSVIFPPGYAVALTLGFWVHAPLLVGPVLGALLVLATFALARQLTQRTDVALVAAALSVLCAALRYHTADTMSHGLSALLLCSATWLALRARRWDALLCGLALGWLIATRPISGAVAVLLALCLLERRAARLAAFCAGLVPGVALLLLYQRAATGSFLGSTQLGYYALADGPPGCFRYGFGRGIGCLYEHGDYVRARLQQGYGLREAANVTIRRLAVHCVDIANAAPLALLCPVGAWLGRAQRSVRVMFWACLGFMLAYAPFYFDGSYPGGGTRLFADLLPLEHVLLAIALVRLNWSRLALPMSLTGFALHASFAHRSLAERDGGRPMFEPAQLARAGVDHGLVFVNTDHAFNLAHEPGQLNAQAGLVVARSIGDAHDWLLWNRLGRPNSYRSSYAPGALSARAMLERYTPVISTRFESEAEWPLLAVQSGWAQPDFPACASAGRALRLNPTDPMAGMSVEFELAAANSGLHTVRLGWVASAGSETRLSLEGADSSWRGVSMTVPAGSERCEQLDSGALRLPAGPTRVRLRASRPGWLDFVELSP